MENKLTVRVKNVYGKKTVYPVCNRSQILARMLGQVTLTLDNVIDIKKLGFELNIVPETL